MHKIFSKFFLLFFRKLTEFSFKYKKIAKIILKIFFEKFFLWNFFWKHSFYEYFFRKIFFYKFFFGENFSFHKNISFVFDVCGIMYFAKFFVQFFFLKINRILTDFFSNIKKLPKLFVKFFSNFFLRKFFSTNFFLVEIFFIEFFLAKIFFFHKNISAKIFFTIFSRISFVFDVCEIIYFAKFFIRNFAYCEFFCFAILSYGKKIVNFFCDFFFSDERKYQVWKFFFSEKK